MFLGISEQLGTSAVAASSKFPASSPQLVKEAMSSSTLTVDSTSISSEILTDQERGDLLSNARSIERLIKWSGCFMRCDDGLLCKYCGTSLFYDYSNGDSFTDDILPSPFRHLKYDLKRHLQSDKHLSNSKNYNGEQEKCVQLEKLGKESALNCANAAYFTYKMDMSYESYESLICLLHNSNCGIGVKNHSKEFPRLFLPVVHSVLHKEIASFIISNDLPVGVMADKVTVNHRSRHIIGLRVPFFDINSKNLYHSVYLEHNFVNDFTGKGLASSMLGTLDKFGFNLPFLRKNLVGLAVDGQYIKLGVANHIKNELALNDIPASWDMMHRIELMQKHSEMPDVVSKAHSLIQESMKQFNYGSKYEALLKCSEGFSDFFYKPKMFKSMKFVAYSKDVFKTFLGDYKFLVSACEQDPELFSLRDKLLTKSSMFNVLLLADTYDILSKLSKQVQSCENLPWEYLQQMENLGTHLDIYLRYINSLININNTEELCKVIENLPVSFFCNTKTAIEMFESCTYQGVTLPDLPVSSKHLRSVKTAVLIQGSQLSENYRNDINSFVKFVTSLREQFNVYRQNEKPKVDNMIEMAGYLFNFDFLQFPRNNVSIQQAAEDKGFTCETFSEYVRAFTFFSNNTHEYDKQTLWFEFKQLCVWFTKTIDANRSESTVYNAKALLKLAVRELRSKYPSIIKFLIFSLAIPVSEAICESWGSVVNNVITKRPMSSDGSTNDIGITDMRVFIMLNGPPAGYKNIRKFLKIALIEKYGMSYYKHFKNISASKVYQKSVMSKVVTRLLEDLANCLPCFQ